MPAIPHILLVPMQGSFNPFARDTEKASIARPTETKNISQIVIYKPLLYGILFLILFKVFIISAFAVFLDVAAFDAVEIDLAEVM